MYVPYSSTDNFRKFIQNKLKNFSDETSVNTSYRRVRYFFFFKSCHQRLVAALLNEEFHSKSVYLHFLEKNPFVYHYFDVRVPSTIKLLLLTEHIGHLTEHILTHIGHLISSFVLILKFQLIAICPDIANIFVKSRER